MKEKRTGSKNKWSHIFKKKWFFPAVYLTVAALLLTVVVWYQNVGNQVQDAKDKVDDNYVPNLHDEDAKSVLDQQEIIQMPVENEEAAQIVTKFYDYNADKNDQEAGLILYNNRYYQSTGVSIASDGKDFDVVAALSGEVTEVKEDPLLGNIVVMNHKNDVMTYYASLGEVVAEVGDKLKQGDTLGSAGKNLFTKDNGIQVHFELRKDGQEVNPEQFFNQPVAKLDSMLKEEAKEEKETTATNEEEESKEKESKEEETKEDEQENNESKTDEKEADETSDSDKSDEESAKTEE